MLVPGFSLPFRMIVGWIIYALTQLSPALATAAQPTVPPGDGSPNIVVILVDDMGYGDTGSYNPSSKIQTPHIDRLAAEGRRFLDAHAAGPLCHMSRYGLLTGRYPFRIDVSRWTSHALIEPEQATLASMLKEQGYRTVMVGKWHLGFNEQGCDQQLPGGPVDVGFDSFFGLRASTDIPPYFYIRDRHAVQPPTEDIPANSSPGWSPIQGKFWRAGKIAPDLDLADVLPRFTDEAVEVIRGHAQQQAATRPPLFLYLAYPSPHTPWLPSEEFAGRSQVPLYGDFMEMVDAMVGRVLEALDQAEMAEDTLIVFTSDNGPVWYDEDIEQYGHDSAGGLRGMKGDAWEAGHRVPFIVRWPGHTPAASSSHQLVGFTDLFATFATITGYPLRPNDAPDSFDFSPELWPARFEGSAAAGQPILRSSWAMGSGNGLMVYREGDYKWISGLGSGGFSKPGKRQPQGDEPPVQLYDLGKDLAEKHNLAGSHRELAERLESSLERIREQGYHRPR